MSAPAKTDTTSRGSFLVAAGIALSRVAGLVREVTTAAFFGNSIAVDAFSAAVRIPNTLQNLLGEGVLSASFIPSYTALLAQGRTKEAGRVAGTILSLLMVVTAALVLLGVFAAEPLTSIFAAGFTGERRALTVTLIRIITPGIGLLVLSAWCLGILNSHRQFFLSYVAPVMWNLAQIVALLVAGTLVFTDIGGDGAVATLSADARGLIIVLAWATVAGAALQLAVQIPRVRRLQAELPLSLHIDPQSRTVLERFAPVVGARGVVQLSALLDTFLATFLVAGALSSLRYGQALYILPISIFGMSIAASELPELSIEAATQEADVQARAIRRRLRAGLSRINYFVVPTAVAYVAVGDVVVGTLFQRGEFTRTDTLQVWAIICAYGLGLVAVTAARLLQSALYGLGDTRTPARASIARIAGSVAVGGILMLQFDSLGIGASGLVVVGDLPAFAPVAKAVREASDTIPRLGAMGLALGVSLGSWIELRVLRAEIQRRIGPVSLSGGVLDQTLGGALAAVATTIVIRLLLPDLPPLVLGIATLGPAAGVYLVVTRSLGFPVARALNGRSPDRSATARRARRKPD